MALDFEIRVLHPFTQAEIWPILDGYETEEVYLVEKTESDQHSVIDIRLVRLEQAFHDDFYGDFSPEEYQRYLGLIPQGYSFGAYRDERLIGFALGEALPDEHFLRVWEFHVASEFRRMGVGRALMERVIQKARGDHLSMILLETQNTNVRAVRFYRSMGFALEALDFSPPHYAHPRDNEVHQVAFYMKARLASRSNEANLNG
jgi:ribosomal protein S18 acetylase RimI-like enzyme